MERFSNWCLVSHGHDLMPAENGLWVRYSDHVAALEKDRKDAERYRWLRRDQRDFWIIKRPQDATEAELNRAFDEAIDKLRTTEPLLVAPPVTKGKAESHIDHPLRHFDRTCQACISQLNHVVDDYDLTSNDTRRGD